MSQEAQILRVVIVCNASGILLAEYVKPEWTFLREDKAIGSLLRSLISLAKEFDEGIVHYVSFKSPSESPLAQSRRASTSGPMNLNLALTLKNDVITGVFYRVLATDAKVVEAENAGIEAVATKILDEFAREHQEYYVSIKPVLEEAFHKSEDPPPGVLDRLLAYAGKIPGMIDQ